MIETLSSLKHVYPQPITRVATPVENKRQDVQKHQPSNPGVRFLRGG